MGVGGLSNISKKMTTPFSGSKMMNLFFYFESKKCFPVLTSLGLYGAEWDKRRCSLCTFQPFCSFDGFGDLTYPVVPILRGAHRHVVIVYAY